MRALTSTELLGVWESGSRFSPAERAIALLRTATNEDERDGEGDPALLPIGKRDARLLALRERLFGPEIAGVVKCAGCGEPVEVRFPVKKVLLAGKEPPARLALDIGEYSAEFRLPNSFDLAAIGSDCLSAVLLDRCLLRATRGGVPVRASELPESVVDAIGETMAAADPQAEIEFVLECPACDREWSQLFDIESFLWHELQGWAGRTLHEVHQLASAYGWSERDILSLSPARRDAYLALIGEY